MNKKIQIIVVIFLTKILVPLVLFACDLNKFYFGLNINQFNQEQKNNLKVSDQRVHQNIILPSDDYCLIETGVRGGVIKLKFLFNTLVQIKIELENLNPNLRDWSEKQYGTIEPKFKKMNNYQYLWVKGQLDVVYSLQTVGEKKHEYLEISSTKFNNLFYEYNKNFENEKNGKY